MESGMTIFTMEHGETKVISNMVGILPITNDWIFHMGHAVQYQVKDIHYNASENKLYVYLKPIEDGS